MDLPKELKQLIASFLDDKSVLKIRLIDKKWFNSIKNIHFPVYMPRSETLPLMMKSLSRYNTPISLTIHKPVRIPLRDFIEQVAKLSNLTSLTFPHFADFEYDPSQRDQPEWHLLTNLTRLREVKLLKPVRLQSRDQLQTLRAPEGFLRALVHLPHLATLHLTNCNYTSKELNKCVMLLKKLDDLSAPTVPTPDLFPSMSTHLTRLCFSLPHKDIPATLNEFNCFHNLKVLQLLGLNIQHLSLTEISSLVTLEVSAKQVTGLDNNTKLRRLVITAHDDTFYDQIRKLPNLEWLRLDMKAENKDPLFFNEFNKLTYLCLLMEHKYELCNISRSVKTLKLDIALDFNYASLAVLTSLDSLTVNTWSSLGEEGDYLAEISTLTGLTRLTVDAGDDLTLANLSTLTNIEELHTGTSFAIEPSFLSHLTKLRGLSNARLRKEHYSEIATLTQLTYLACINKYEERGNFISLLSHLPLRLLVTEFSEEDLNPFLRDVSAMTALELLEIFNEPQDIEIRADWSILSNLTRLTRLNLDLYGLTRDTLTSLTRVTSLQYLNVTRPQEEYDDEDEDQQENQNIESTPNLDNWLPFSTSQFPNLISVSYLYSSVYSGPFTLDDPTLV